MNDLQAVCSYLLIETRSSWESHEVAGFLQLAGSLADAGHQVDLFLIQNGVLMARHGTEPLLEALQGKPGVTVWVDDFSLASRYPEPGSLIEKAAIGGAATLVKLMARSNCKSIWH